MRNSTLSEVEDGGTDEGSTFVSVSNIVSKFSKEVTMFYQSIS